MLINALRCTPPTSFVDISVLGFAYLFQSALFFKSENLAVHFDVHTMYPGIVAANIHDRADEDGNGTYCEGEADHIDPDRDRDHDPDRDRDRDPDRDRDRDRDRDPDQSKPVLKAAAFTSATLERR